MTIVAEYSVPGKGIHKNKLINVLVLKCDVCASTFEKHAKVRSSHHHFCGKECVNVAQLSGGILDRKKVTTCFARHGVMNPSQSEEIAHKKRLTCVKNYGVSYGFLQRNKRDQTMVARFGVKHALKSPVLWEKAKQTWIVKYGVDNPTKLEKNKQVLRDAISLRKNIGISKKEALFGDWLRSTFGDVKTQQVINGWRIDFYVPSLKTYVQFDGMFWHGLNERSQKFDFVQRRMQIDEEQNRWFSSNGVRLVRVSEKTFDIAQKNVAIFDDIKQTLENA